MSGPIGFCAVTSLPPSNLLGSSSSSLWWTPYTLPEPVKCTETTKGGFSCHTMGALPDHHLPSHSLVPCSHSSDTVQCALWSALASLPASQPESWSGVGDLLEDSPGHPSV